MGREGSIVQDYQTPPKVYESNVLRKPGGLRRASEASVHDVKADEA
jgi:hypothetical protein